ncbi:MarR family winged helix-turn-helix transcriptional regulator [Bradyrhizobium sp. 2S1]|uniref:MarR family winged helix-turn-helix transcriptional regulator n=1 Tax=Bradyrhizobium sp. 2S1 TaxID=1404429 RepID=UPI001407E6E6|nr:MarR family winged helix-turn-helix transcriptional regulator [Bradyrhizobium sp. 2S1]MCK7667701.1 MarR family winged helix-turn-helix transcriptional regulator [Bradyrhizobium sp. 2S1]
MPKANAQSSRHRKPSTADLPAAVRSTARTHRVAKATELQLQRLTGCLHSLSSRHHDLTQGYAAHVGIAGIQYTILTTIRYLETKGDVFPVTVAEYLGLASAGVTKAIQHLTELGLVEKAGDLDDRRRTRLTVTHGGSILLDSLAPMQSNVNDVWLDCMNDEEFSIFLDLVERFIRSSDRALAMQDYLARDSDIVSF